MSNHEWCRDVSRDEAVRAAEDAAAVPSIQHRDLPEVVAELRERVAELTTKHNALADLARLDAGWLKASEQRLTAEITRLREERRWIPVSKRLPDSSTILASDGDVVLEARYYAGYGWECIRGDQLWFMPTHWMPLPAPPGGEVEG